MLQVTFKNVGQGDSIILEWEDEEGKPNVGIIDCKKVRMGVGKMLQEKGSRGEAAEISEEDVRSNNPVVDHLRNKQCKKIKFIIISHPHRDHYSGMQDLIDYCCNNKNAAGTNEPIHIDKFYYSVHSLGVKIADELVNGNKDALKKVFGQIYTKHLDSAELSELTKILVTLKRLREQQVISEYYDMVKGIYLLLNDQSGNILELNCLSPSTNEIDIFQAGDNTTNPFEKAHNDDGNVVNILSTVIRVSGPNFSVVLTADCPSKVLDRVLTESKKHFAEREHLLLQAPHHGAFDNYHNEAFWKRLKESHQPLVVFSSGANEKYKHPSENTVISFINLGYQDLLYATNHVHGLAGLQNTNGRFQGDKIFNVSRDGIQVV